MSASYIGVTVAILGNVCISAALNIQKHVHNKLALRAAARQEAKLLHARQSPPSDPLEEVSGGHAGSLAPPASSLLPAQAGSGASNGAQLPRPPSPDAAARQAAWRSVDDSGIGVSPSAGFRLHPGSDARLARLSDGSSEDTGAAAVFVDDGDDGNYDDYDDDDDQGGEEDDLLLGRSASNSGSSMRDSMSETAYLGERLWWLGMGVMFLGELGNFAAYGFAPAVLVAPLGTVALISNALIAPVFLGETLRRRDMIGILFSIIGTGIILGVSSQTSEPSLSPEDIVDAITQPQFVVYFIVTAGLAALMLGASYTPQGRKYIFVDLLIVAVFGGYTVLATKALSSLLKYTFLVMFGHWITYLMLFVLVTTAVLQVQYLNRALSGFDSVEVIPTNFVLFTTSSIVGSSILYNDLQHTDPTALLGVVCMFFGVILITGERGAHATRAGSEVDVAQVDVELGYDGDSEDGALRAGAPALSSVSDVATDGDAQSGAATPRWSQQQQQQQRQGRAAVQQQHSQRLVDIKDSGFPASSLPIEIAISLPSSGNGSRSPRRTPTASPSGTGSLLGASLSGRYPSVLTGVSAGRGTAYTTMDGHPSAGRNQHQQLPQLQQQGPALLAVRRSRSQRFGSLSSPPRSAGGFPLPTTPDRSQQGSHGGHGGAGQHTGGSLHTRPSHSDLSSVSLPSRMADSTLKHLAAVFQAVGTHQIRRMELERMSEHGSSVYGSAATSHGLHGSHSTGYIPATTHGGAEQQRLHTAASSGALGLQYAASASGPATSHTSAAVLFPDTLAHRHGPAVGGSGVHQGTAAAGSFGGRTGVLDALGGHNRTTSVVSDVSHPSVSSVSGLVEFPAFMPSAPAADATADGPTLLDQDQPTPSRRR
ncbi:hypothetical protein HK105_209176 [Polyrhizophydium stewartii]|uniref:DUF803-domain-containing protein n=1 Tax=Polyrhizophydium stewartii TaxID=2732419 RepID=A0ABR4MVS8_9FUNG